MNFINRKAKKVANRLKDKTKICEKKKADKKPVQTLRACLVIRILG